MSTKNRPTPSKQAAPGITLAQVFLNVPYSKSYERTLLALTAALVAVGRFPRLTFQLPDGGQGRLQRIFALLRSCRVSIHDLSSVGLPVRFNMPFELGLACALKEQTNQHDFMVLDRRAHRLDRHLSDLKGVDAKIHHGTVRGAICAILESLDKPAGNPTAADVMKLYRRMCQFVPVLKARHGNRELFSARVYGELVALGFETAREMKL
jgi:hypothetical protein